MEANLNEKVGYETMDQLSGRSMSGHNKRNDKNQKDTYRGESEGDRNCNQDKNKEGNCNEREEIREESTRNKQGNEIDQRIMQNENKSGQLKENEIKNRRIAPTKLKVKKKQEMMIGIWNINTLTGKEMEIAEEMESNNLQILGLSETKKKGRGYRQLTNKHTLYYSGVSQERRAKEGVGIIITEEMNKNVIKYKPVNSRIIRVSIKTNDIGEVINIIQIYGPVEGAHEEEILEFYINLQRELDEAREDNEATIIMGDWNSRVGNDKNRGMGCMGIYGEPTINRNGIKMIEFCRRNDLVVGNTMWYQQIDEKYTFVAEERNARSLIDYFVYTQSLIKIIQKVQTKKEAEAGTSHRLVTAQMEVSIGRNEEKKEYSKIAIQELKKKEKNERYEKVTNEEFQRRESEREDWTLEERWGAFKEIVISSAERVCGRRKYNNNIKRTKWWTEEIRKLVKEKKTAWKKYLQTKTIEDKEDYIRRRNVVKLKIKEEKKKSWRDFGEEITNTQRINNRKFWTQIKRLRGSRKKEIKAIKDKNNQLQTEVEQILDIWRDYYVDKFHRLHLEEDANLEERETEHHEITREEVEEVIQNIKIGKASGEDGIAPEFIKCLGESGIDWIWKIIKEVWEKKQIPREWENNLIIPIHKKGEQTQCENYRAICLAQTSYKLYTKILEKRLRQCLEQSLEEEQAAFRPERQTNDNIFIVRNLIERTIEKGEEMFLIFIDLKSAFDTVIRREVWTILEEMKIPKGLTQAIRSTYDIVRARIQIAGQTSEEFLMDKGIKQGDSLSPLLFILIMDKIVKNIKRQGEHLNTVIGYRNMEPVKMSSLLYADDVVLIANSKSKTQKLMNVWTSEIEKMKMEVNINKTKVMIINENQNDRNKKEIKCKDTILERVTTYEYLGSVMTEDGKIEAEITNRANKSTKIYYTMNKTILGHKNIDIDVKMKIHNAITVPTITYAAENWTIGKKDEAKINAIEMKHLRRIAGKTKWDRIKNEDIRKITKQEPIMERINKKQLNWYGHIVRMKPDRIARKLMEAGNINKKRRGRPRRKWIDQIRELGTQREKTLEEMRGMAKSRRQWKEFVQGGPESPSDT